MLSKMENYMAINTADGKVEEIMGKYMYYSLPKLIVKAERVKEICSQIGFPIEVNENISITDAFRSATGEIHDRIEDNLFGELKIVKIYCRDNKKAETDVLSRELVEETLYETTNTYRKLANITLDKSSGEMVLSDVDYTSDRDIRGYFNEAQRLFELYDILSLNDIGFTSDIVEDGYSFQENAMIKADAIVNFIKGTKYENYAVISDDSGLCVKALNYEPGIYSSRYSGGGDKENRQLLIAFKKSQNQRRFLLQR